VIRIAASSFHRHRSLFLWHLVLSTPVRQWIAARCRSPSERLAIEEARERLLADGITPIVAELVFDLLRRFAILRR
jgi:hypothetical protein